MPCSALKQPGRQDVPAASWYNCETYTQLPKKIPERWCRIRKFHYSGMAYQSIWHHIKEAMLFKAAFTIWCIKIRNLVLGCKTLADIFWNFQIYISGQITESQLDTKIELKIRHGVSSLTEFLFLGCILYILLLYSSKIYNISSQTLVITTTIILIALITLHSYFISKYSHIANEIEKDLFYTIKRILNCSETTY